MLDLPAGMAVATSLVLTLTGVAPLIGVRLSGLIATYPVFAAVLSVFAHHQHEVAAAQRVLRGLTIGLFSFTCFFLVVTMGLERLGPPQASSRRHWQPWRSKAARWRVDAPIPCNLVTLMSIFDLPKCIRYRFARNRQLIA